MHACEKNVRVLTLNLVTCKILSLISVMIFPANGKICFAAVDGSVAQRSFLIIPGWVLTI